MKKIFFMLFGILCLCSFSVGATSNNSQYKYITKTITETYWNNDATKTGEVEINVTFRYNPKSKEVKCLSASHKTKNVSDGAKIKAFTRTQNMKTNLGGALVKVKIKPENGKGSDYKVEIKITCDSEGKISVDKYTLD